MFRHFSWGLGVFFERKGRGNPFCAFWGKGIVGIRCHHGETTAFDEGTKIKLLLYEQYLKEWLPVFLAQPRPVRNVVNIFNFLFGPGNDINNQKGSPLIANV